MISDMTEIRSALTSARTELVCLAADVGECEHSINICRCRILLTIKEIKIVLEELVECGTCHNNTMYAPYSVTSCKTCKGEGYTEVDQGYGQGIVLGVE